MLSLEADKVQADGWLWRLLDEGGDLLQSHQVDLSDAEYREAFENLYAWVGFRVEARDRLASEQRLIDRLGNWVGEKVFGPVGDAIAERAPVTVRVVIPRDERQLLYRPLELAVVGGRPLVDQDAATRGVYARAPGYVDPDLAHTTNLELLDQALDAGDYPPPTSSPRASAPTSPAGGTSTKPSTTPGVRSNTPERPNSGPGPSSPIRS